MQLICPNCGENTGHKVISTRVGDKGIWYVLQCTKCGYTYKKYIENEKIKDVKVIWSWREKSEVKKISLFEEDTLKIGDEITVNGINSKITAIDSMGRRVKSAKVKDMDTIWAKRFDKVIVKISVNRGRKTIPVEIVVHPDEEFYVGDIINIKKMKCVIHKIKIEKKFIVKGSALARDIVRIYAKEIRER